MRFTELVTELRSDIWPEGVPENLVAPIHKSFEAAVTHLQRYVPCLQSRNINRYPQCSTYFQGGKTVIDAPKGRINKVYTVLDKEGDEVYPALFTQVSLDQLECNNLKLLSMVYPPRNLDKNPLPMGFKYPEEDSDFRVTRNGTTKTLTTNKHGRAVIGQWAIDRNRIYISPWINSDEVIVVEWDGVKTRYSLDDAVIEDIDFKRAVKLYVQREYARDFDNDYERYKYMSMDFDTAMGDLIHECKKQTEVKKTFFCPEAYDILAQRRNQRFNEALNVTTTTTATTEAATTTLAADAAVDVSFTFGVIGDYGASTGGSGTAYDGTNSSAVADLVKGWSPEFIITTGDNSYGATGGDQSTITDLDTNVGQWYSDFIFPYGQSGLHGYTSTSNATTGNRFFPSIGNHDITEAYGTTDAGLAHYKNYFTLPNNEEYYDFVKGPIHFFCLFSNKRTDNSVYNAKLGLGITGGQHEWLESKLGNSSSHWKVVYFHNSPYSSETASGGHGPGDTDMRWDFPAMGADVVISGHAHNYERIKDANDFRYLVNGAGGAPLRGSGATLPNGYTSEKFHSAANGHGAIKGTVDGTTLKFEFIDKAGTTIDTYTLTKALSDTSTKRTVTN